MYICVCVCTHTCARLLMGMSEGWAYVFINTFIFIFINTPIYTHT